MARWSPVVASLILMSHTLARETTGTYARTLASKASSACATCANRLAAIAKAARQRFIGDMLQITEQQAVASAHSGLHDVAQMTTLAITSKLTIIVASAAFSTMESRGSMCECFRNSPDRVDLGQRGSAPPPVCTRP